MTDKYTAFEEQFLKEANKAILIDEGTPTLMQNMDNDFIRLLQGSLVLMKGTQQPTELYTPGDSKEYNINPNRMKARNSQGEDILIKLSDYIKQDANESKLIPDLDMEKIKISKRHQFIEFVKMFTALEQEDNRRGGLMRQPSARGSATVMPGGARDPPQLNAGSEGYKS